MLDINQAMAGLAAGNGDPEGHLHDTISWSREIAKQQARDEGLGELSETQWRVIHTLRGLYRRNGRASNARQVIQHLEADFADEGGRRFLYLEFPGGPVTQGCRLAGVPAPPYAADHSFGSVA